MADALEVITRSALVADFSVGFEPKQLRSRSDLAVVETADG